MNLPLLIKALRNRQNPCRPRDSSREPQRRAKARSWSHLWFMSKSSWTGEIPGLSRCGRGSIGKLGWSLEQERGNMAYAEVMDVRNESILIIVKCNRSNRSKPTGRTMTSKSINQEYPKSVMEDSAVIWAIQAGSRMRAGIECDHDNLWSHASEYHGSMNVRQSPARSRRTHCWFEWFS
jgi:hypothetical protein